MEKLSLYDLLSILLPGAILTLIINMIATDFGISIENMEISNYFSLTIFLSSSIFLGSVINVITWRISMPIHRKVGLFDKISVIYNKNNSLAFRRIKPFFEELHIKLVSQDEDIDCKEHDKIEHVWSEIYYELEAKEQISAPKNFQSFYFFFRNFFTMGLILTVIITTSLVLTKELKYLILLVVNAFGIITSIFAGKWYRQKMVSRMFWTYYSLYKNKK